MKINIFGTTGFIGENLTDKLHENYKISAVSLRNNNWNNELVESEVFINLVGKAHDHNKTATEADFHHVNVDLTKDIFNAFIESDAALFIHVSSLAALEEFESTKPLNEEDICNPNSWYAKSKREAEIWLMNQKLPENKKMIVLRPPMVHGKGDKGNLVLLYKLISKGIPYPLASFENNRSFISIDNFCFFIDEIIKNKNKLDSGIYHISDDEIVSSKEIIKIIQKVENKKTLNVGLPKFFVKGLAKIGDILPIPLNSIRLKKMTSDLMVSNQKIKSALGIEKLPLSAEEGLIKTIKSFTKEK
ncbi:NAD-dependent epimerase/dehydratase family protein [Chryseobacterium sp. RG1]|uniref:NAD-dependent epimerase/dehydratase family protein n=1 Tax=Chryseobacterium tagetis TaxID=2801334 RepID=A0ABS8A725_9FLAO|nr:NAD-dependent epimerase/dehydratase family protein [Chryseobacterium tagetis]MCA6069113.1 NAD-dependent epimerase/dehydratase family protein [Chryseobacterium tagetis]